MKNNFKTNLQTKAAEFRSMGSDLQSFINASKRETRRLRRRQAQFFLRARELEWAIGEFEHDRREATK